MRMAYIIKILKIKCSHRRWTTSYRITESGITLYLENFRPWLENDHEYMWWGKVILGRGNSICKSQSLKRHSVFGTQYIYGQGREDNENTLFPTMGSSLPFKVNCPVVKWIHSVEKPFLCKMKMFNHLIYLDLALTFLSRDVKMKLKVLMWFLQIVKTLCMPL